VNDHDEYVIDRQMAEEYDLIDVVDCPRCGEPMENETANRLCYACTIEENL
jgi:formylmethanofuran dehydrogenase subunit E